MKRLACHVGYCLIVIITDLCVAQEPCVPLSVYQDLQQQLSFISAVQMMTTALGFGSGIIYGRTSAPPVPASTTPCPSSANNIQQIETNCPAPTPCPTVTTSCLETTTCSTAALQAQINDLQAQIDRFEFCTAIGNSATCMASSRCQLLANCVPRF